jgi:phospholipid/cholesterol/gamma-HCH transport system ATP-binding protein
VISLKGVYKSFGEKRVLRGLDLEVGDDETLVVLGRSGTGKSVTLKTVVGLIRPDRGTVEVGGVDVTRADLATLRRVRRDVAYLFQTGALINWLTVRENVALPLVERREHAAREIGELVDRTLASLDLAEAGDQYPDRISGGMRKRAALCRVLIQEPRTILYDEPTAGLDPILARTVSQLIRDVQDAGERSALVVTHDLELAFAVADRIGLHHDGRLVEVGTPDAFRESRHPVVRAFLDGKTSSTTGENP